MNMNCPNCQALNPDHARFCLGCGASLSNTSIQCSNCQSALPPEARFCPNCGQMVNPSATKDDARLTRLVAATPAPLASKIRAAHLGGERKLVTCLFADVVGSTALAERMDPEDWTEIMNQAFDLLSPSVYRYEGTIARLMGDALLAFFGAPIVHEDDPERAVLAGLDLIKNAYAYRDFVQQKYKLEFAIRVGINTGPVVVGNVGSDLKYEYTAMGDAVNLAARLQSSARPMTVLISDATKRFVAPVFELADLGPIEVKGKSEPVIVYEVQGVKTERSQQRGLAASGLTSPLVGRADELTALMQASTTLQVKGQLAVILGEAGLGKSRLISEWRIVTQSNDKCHWTEGRCLSFGQGLPYHLMTDWLSSLISVSITASETEVLNTLRAFLDRQGVGEALPYLGHLLLPQSLDPAIASVKALDAQLLQMHYVTALSQLLTALAAQRPLIVILDDVHWADPSSVELFEKLIPLVAEQPILFVFVARADQDAPGWKLIIAARALQECLTEISLTPLSEPDSHRLVINLLATSMMPEHVRALILGKTEGNPFFVEEVIRMLMDRGAFAHPGSGRAMVDETDIANIPDNLQGLLLARIDRLDEAARRTLRVAAVIGRLFSWPVLEAVMGAALDLVPLETAGLVYQTSVERQYMFRHALIQEAAYNSLVKQDRRSLHVDVGLAIERLYPERLATSELAVTLGEHFYRGNDEVRALKYLVQAAISAAQVYANAEAIQYYSKALELCGADHPDRFDLILARVKILHIRAERMAEARDLDALEAIAERSNDDARRASVALQRSSLASTVGDYASAETHAHHAATCARQAGAAAQEAEAYLAWGMALWHFGQQAAAREQSIQALTLSRQNQMSHVEAKTLRLLGIIANAQSDYADAQTYLDQSLELFRQLKDRQGEGDCLNSLGVVAFHMNDAVLARSYYEDASHIKEELGDRYGQGVILNNLGIVARQQRDYSASVGYFEESLKICREIHDREGEASALNGLGSAAVFLGDHTAARDFIDQALAITRAIGDREGEMNVLIEQSALRSDAGDTQAALASGHEAVAIAQELGARSDQARSLLLVGWPSLQIGDLDEAHRAFDAALEMSRSLDLPGEFAEALAGLALVALRQNKIASALEHAQQILDLGSSGPPDLSYRAQLALYRVLLAGGDARAATILETACQSLQTEIASLDEPLRARFVDNVPYRQELLAEWTTRTHRE